MLKHSPAAAVPNKQPRLGSHEAHVGLTTLPIWKTALRKTSELSTHTLPLGVVKEACNYAATLENTMLQIKHLRTVKAIGAKQTYNTRIQNYRHEHIHLQPLHHRL